MKFYYSFLENTFIFCLGIQLVENLSKLEIGLGIFKSETPKMKLYKSLSMEIRPRIQSVNVHIVLLKKNTVNVNLHVDNFEIEIGLATEKIQCDNFHIKPNSLTCFANEDHEVIFRFATQNLKDTTSCYELLATEIQSCCISKNKPETFLSKNLDYTMTCSACKQIICEQITFKRILPLPENLDSSNWFCHSHADNYSLIPKEDEMFYSQCFMHLNSQIIQFFIQKGDVLNCTNCKCWIGIVQKDVCKIWFNTVVFSSNGNKFVSCPLYDCIDTILLDNDLLLRSARIALKCVSNPYDDILLLWVLEPKLLVRFIDEDCDFNGNVAKVLYKYGNAKTDTICKWISDFNVTVLDVSKPMIDQLVNHLINMGSHIPKSFSASNSFCVSYIKFYRNENM